MNQLKPSKYFLFLAALLLFITQSCSLPDFVRREQVTPSAEGEQIPVPEGETKATPILPTPQPLPPAVVESTPSPEAELPLLSPVTFYFNQPMDQDSVEAALSVQPAVSGSFTWSDEATLVFQPSQPLSPESQVVFTFNSQARSTGGLFLPEPVSLEYRTAGYLELSEILPEPGAGDVDPTSAVVVAFNRPVVPLGADPASLPPAFTLDPLPQGRSEWLNTSTFIFYPDPQFEGGKTYTVRLNSDLRSEDGSPLKQADEPLGPSEWSFSTALPRLAYIEPDPRAGTIRLDEKFVLKFNQVMDPSSVEAGFRLEQADNAAVAGTAAWSENNTKMTFTPSSPLVRDTLYTLRLSPEAQGGGGTPLGEGYTTEYRTVPDLEVVSTDPSQGAVKPFYQDIRITFNGPVSDRKLDDYVLVEPEISNLQVWWNEVDRTLALYGGFQPSQSHTVRISPDLPDPWGGKLEKEFVFSVTNASLPPGIVINNMSNALFLTGQDARMTAQVTNLTRLPLSVGEVPLQDFFRMVSGENPYEFRQSYNPVDEVSWEQSLDADPNRTQNISFYLQPDRSPLRPGLYFLRLNTQPPPDAWGGRSLLAVSDIQLTFKLSATEVFVWGVTMDAYDPVPGAPVTIYDPAGQALASGQTDEQGVFHSEISALKDTEGVFTAIMGEPGQDNFGVALSDWSFGVGPWDFNIRSELRPPQLEGYLYTDRPIYRPGQTVYFRAVVRQGYNGRYTLPEMTSLPMLLSFAYGQKLASFEVPISTYGTAHGQYTLPEDSKPGIYNLSYDSPDPYVHIGVNFQVAEYRKPEIDVKVRFATEQALASDTLEAHVDARYYFGAPAGNVPVAWTLSATPDSFPLPGYETGIDARRWMEIATLPYHPQFGRIVSYGEAVTAPDGTLTLEFPPVTVSSPAYDAYLQNTRQLYTLEVTLQDESGLPVSGRGSTIVNPADFYIGVQPESWVGRAEEETGFKLQVVNWQGAPAGERSLHADFQKVIWVRTDTPVPNQFTPPTFTPQYTPVGSTDFNTDSQGKARLVFTPPEPGTYFLDLTGSGASTALLLWVGGPGDAIWPSLPNSRLELTADRDAYQPGDTAQIFVPNPFTEESLALVAVERDVILHYQILEVAPGGTTLDFPLSGDDAPNVYVSVTMLGRTAQGRPDFRAGYLNLAVAPVEQTFTVNLASQPDKTGPGDEVTFDLQVTDNDGKPVQGEFSLSLVDRAVLALADPNVPDIQEAFYGNQPLGIRNGIALAAYTERDIIAPLGGLGGGDGAGPSFVRERFLDTAYWDAQITTDGQGQSSVTLVLPDNLTTWQVLARGVTLDTLVGQGEVDLLTTKDLLVRPVVPRFLVAGDHAQLAAVVQNNTSSDLDVLASLQASGVTLDDQGAASQSVSVPAGGGVRVAWWVRVQDVDSVDLLFSAVAGELNDAARPALGKIPVLRYTAPQTFSTAGILDEGGERLELVSLPRSFDPSGGRLEVELAPSLTSAMASALSVLEYYPYQCTEQTLSRFLPNLETYRLMQEFGTVSPDVQSRFDRTLQEGLKRLIAQQNFDGGWGWWSGEQSDPYITAYVVYGLSRARETDAIVDENVIARAMEYLQGTLFIPQISSGISQLDRLAFAHFALMYAGKGDLQGIQGLYEVRDRLSPWSKALVALSLEKLSPGSEAAQTMFSDLEATAIRSATGAHWEEQTAMPQNMTSPLTTSAMVIFALAQIDPESPILADATRYLVLNREADGAWGSTYETAWNLLALNQVIQATGDLSGRFSYSADLNNVPLASGQADSQGEAVNASMPISQLNTQGPNALQIRRESGSGRLYYTAALNVDRPVEDVAPLANGIAISRAYYSLSETCTENECPAVQGAPFGDLVEVRLTLTLEKAVFHLIVEDYIPAGTEILNESLKTSQQVIPEAEGIEPVPLYDASEPYSEGWGWWLFNTPRVYDDHIAWAADSLPAGTYELKYVLSLTQPGEYQVVPARAWQFYFPEVQGNSAGTIFEIQP